MNVDTVKFSNLINLSSSRNGGEIVKFSDDFLGKAENILEPGRGEYDENLYNEKGKVYDGWGSKRSRNIDNEDFIIIKLAKPGIIQLVDIDTNHFKSNSPMFASVEGCFLEEDELFDEENIKWLNLLNPVYVYSNKQNLYNIVESKQVNYIKLSIYPDGGIARFKAYGTPIIDKTEESMDYASILNGGSVILSSDTYYGEMNNLIKPNVPVNSNDGWGTMRRRQDGNDWVIIKLGKSIELEEIIINTQHFIGNFPESCIIEGINKPKATNLEVYKNKKWILIRDEYKLFSGHEHRITQFENDGKVSHIKISIIPDGGLSRIKIIGK
jgi:allantoicase